MNVTKPLAGLTKQSRERSPVVRGSLGSAGQHLLQLRDTFPEVYGHISYVDPYVDYIIVEMVVQNCSQPVLWAGTLSACQEKWAVLLPKGAV